MVCISISEDVRQHVADLIALQILIEGNLRIAPEAPLEALGDKVADYIADMAARYPGYSPCLRAKSGQVVADAVAEIVTPDTEIRLAYDKLWEDTGHRYQWEPFLHRDDRHEVLGRPSLRARRRELSNPVSPIKSAWRRHRPLRRSRPEHRRRRPQHVLKRMYQALIQAARQDIQAATNLARFQFLSLRQVCPDWYAPYLEQMPAFEPLESAET